MSSLEALFSTEIFMPRGHDYLWTPKLLLVEGVSSVLLALGCLALAVAAVRRRRVHRPALSWRSWSVLALFFAFAAATHLFDLYLIWAPLYWLDALVRGLAAVSAVVAAVALMRDRGDR